VREPGGESFTDDERHGQQQREAHLAGVVTGKMMMLVLAVVIVSARRA
jgi:hypothetical protein